MKIPYFRKVVDSEGNEWVDSQDIFQYLNEYDTQITFATLKINIIKLL